MVSALEIMRMSTDMKKQFPKSPLYGVFFLRIVLRTVLIRGSATIGGRGPWCMQFGGCSLRVIIKRITAGERGPSMLIVRPKWVGAALVLSLTALQIPRPGNMHGAATPRKPCLSISRLCLEDYQQ